MSVFRYVKRTIIQADDFINSFFHPIDSEIKRNCDDVRQRNNNKYGFDALDDFPLNGIHERYKKWLYSEDEEE